MHEIGDVDWLLGALGMLTGYCGTLLTPMAANFNLVPAALLELDDPNGVIRMQVGTALLHESLLHLKTAGLERGTGICKENVPASKFVYPKFGSTVSDVDFDELTASL